MLKRQYPCQVFILNTTTFGIRKVTLDRPYSVTSDSWGAYTKAGKHYRDRDIYNTQKAAIKAGRSQLKRRKKSLEAGLELVAKQTEVLDKAERETK